jgi:hypothetical protein
MKRQYKLQLDAGHWLTVTATTPEEAIAELIKAARNESEVTA